MTNNFILVYLITNIFSVYTLFRFMCIFFERSGTDKRTEFIAYSLYYFLIGLLFITLNNLVVNIFGNLIMFFLLTFNYRSTLKTRLVATVSIYMILMTIETTVVLILKYFGIELYSSDADIFLIVGMVSTKMVSYIAMLILSNFKMVKNNIDVSVLHWLSIFVIPAGTLVLAVMMISTANSDNLIEIIAGTVILFVINIFVFFLYDELMKTYEEKIEKVLLQQQNNAYLKQLDIINQSQESIRVFRHDLKNHALYLKSIISDKDNEAAIDYLNNAISCIDISREYSKSCNSAVDSILNYKLNYAQKLGIKSEVRLQIPEKLNISSFDLIAILGNLLDNAINAASKTENRIISLRAELDRNVLYISIYNSYDGTLNFENGKLVTTHHDRENHGMGLVSVMKSIEKYNGTMNIRQEKNMFYVDVLVYNQE